MTAVMAWLDDPGNVLGLVFVGLLVGAYWSGERRARRILADAIIRHTGINVAAAIDEADYYVAALTAAGLTPLPDGHVRLHGTVWRLEPVECDGRCIGPDETGFSDPINPDPRCSAHGSDPLYCLVPVYPS